MTFCWKRWYSLILSHLYMPLIRDGSRGPAKNYQTKKWSRGQNLSLLPFRRGSLLGHRIKSVANCKSPLEHYRKLGFLDPHIKYIINKTLLSDYIPSKTCTTSFRRTLDHQARCGTKCGSLPNNWRLKTGSWRNLRTKLVGSFLLYRPATVEVELVVEVSGHFIFNLMKSATF